MTSSLNCYRRTEVMRYVNLSESLKGWLFLSIKHKSSLNSTIKIFLLTLFCIHFIDFVFVHLNLKNIRVLNKYSRIYPKIPDIHITFPCQHMFIYFLICLSFQKYYTGSRKNYTDQREIEFEIRIWRKVWGKNYW